MDDQELYQKAKLKAESKIRFYIHCIVFLAVNLLLAIINLKSSPDQLWFLYPFIGWGLALCLHGLMVLGVFDFSEKKRQLVEKELAKEKYKKQMEENG
jgi:hypothetical protein